jgi:hypothetical protein
MTGYTPPTEEPQTDEPCRDCGYDCASPEECESNRGIGDPAHVPQNMARFAEAVDRRRQTHGSEGAPF